MLRGVWVERGFDYRMVSEINLNSVLDITGLYPLRYGALRETCEVLKAIKKTRSIKGCFNVKEV
jgi:hypothetical protein